MNISQTPWRIGEFWPLLVNGQLSVGSVCTDLEVQRLLLRPSRRPEPLKSLNVQVLVRVLCGELQKVIASDAQRSISSVATTAATSLQSMGVPGAAREAPLALIALAHAHIRPRLPYVQNCKVESAGEALSLTFPKLQVPVNCRLSHGEGDVLTLLMFGMSHRDIARLRGTALRTIANQLAGAYTKLGSSGRLQVIRDLLTSPGPAPNTVPQRYVGMLRDQRRGNCADDGGSTRLPVRRLEKSHHESGREVVTASSRRT